MSSHLTRAELREALANQEHDRWARWQSYLHGLCVKNDDGSLTIPTDKAERWQRQIRTPYEELSEREKGSDRKEANETLALLIFNGVDVGSDGA